MITLGKTANRRGATDALVRTAWSWSGPPARIVACGAGSMWSWSTSLLVHDEERRGTNNSREETRRADVVENWETN